MTDREAIDVLFNEWKCIDRNDGIHCDRKCESCDLVMDVEIIREAYNMAISALEEQMPKNSKESSSTQKALDTISRQAAIDALKNERSDWNCDYNVPVDHCIDAIYSVPPAQPQIIRCKDCKYACIDPERESDEIYCSENDFWKDDDWFCGNAERRTDE